MDDVDIKKPDAEIVQYTIYDVSESGKVLTNKKTEVKKVEEKKEEEEGF
jgi:hypothetical protein